MTIPTSDRTYYVAQFKVSKRTVADGWMPWVKKGPEGHPNCPSEWSVEQIRDAIEFWDADHEQQWRIVQHHVITESTTVWEGETA